MAPACAPVPARGCACRVQDLALGHRHILTVSPAARRTSAPPATITIDAAPRPRQVSPSGRFLAVLDSPRSILLVRLSAQDDFDSHAAGDDTAGGREVRAGSKALVLGARFVIPSDYELTGFGWMRCVRVCARVGVFERAHRCRLLCAHARTRMAEAAAAT